MFFTVFTHIVAFKPPCSIQVLWLVCATWRVPQALHSPSSCGCWFRVPYTAPLQRAVAQLQTTNNAPNWNGHKHICLGSLQCRKNEAIWVTLALKTTTNHCWGREFYVKSNQIKPLSGFYFDLTNPALTADQQSLPAQELLVQTSSLLAFPNKSTSQMGSASEVKYQDVWNIPLQYRKAWLGLERHLFLQPFG